MSELQGQLDMGAFMSATREPATVEGYDDSSRATPQSGSATSPGEIFDFQPGAAAACAKAQRRQCVEAGALINPATAPMDIYQGMESDDADRLRYLAAGIRSDFDGAKERVLHAGMLLIEARNRCPQGRWLEWLTQEAGCAERTAQQSMQLYETYGARELPEAYGKLDASHLVELLRAPEEDRDALAAKAAEEALSTRALREEIKQLREDRAQAQVKIHDLIVEQEQMAGDVKAAREAKQVAEARASDAVARANNTAEALRKAKDQIKDLKAREPETVEVERVPEDVAAEMERLKAELQRYREGGEVTPTKEIEIKLRISWYQLTQGFEELLKLVGELNQRDPDKGRNYVGAVAKLCDAMKAKVSPEGES